VSTEEDVTPGARRTLVVLMALTVASVFSMQIIVPSLPSIANEFGRPAGDVQLILTTFLVGYAVFQLVHGPLSDRFGRRSVILVAGVIFAVSSLAAGLAPDLDSVVAARFVQAVGASAVFVIGPAAIRDLYGHTGSVRMIGTINVSAGVAAALAPYLGGLIDEYVGWRWTMLSTAGLAGVVTLVAWYRLDESHPPAKRTRAGIVRLALGYGRILVVPVFALYIFLPSPP
jgi:DHA1 family bicyclomycin/chloramphenicol resistance-like MFS transporter